MARGDATARGGACAATAIVELALAAPAAPAFQRDLLALLERAIGFDVAFAQSKIGPGVLSLAGLDAAAFPATAARQAHYERELAPVKRAAHAARGVAVDTEVLGAAAVRRSAYHRDLAAPVGGAHSLMAYADLRGQTIGGVMLGRCGRGFDDREVSAMEAALPAIALAMASFAVPRVAPAVATDAALTPRERDVLAYLCLGYQNREIARACGSSPHTVRNQLARVFAKLGATTRSEAVAIALGGRAG